MSGKKLVVGILLFAFILIGYSSNAKCQTASMNVMPPEFLTQDLIRKYIIYILVYYGQYEQIEWLVYYLANNQLCDSNGRIDSFAEDLFIEDSAVIEDYKPFGYDWDYMAPKNDMTRSYKTE